MRHELKDLNEINKYPLTIYVFHVKLFNVRRKCRRILKHNGINGNIVPSFRRRLQMLIKIKMINSDGVFASELSIYL